MATASSRAPAGMFEHASIVESMSAMDQALVPIVTKLIEYSGVYETSPARRVLDSACGSGIVTAVLLASGKFADAGDSILCGDISAPMVEQVQKRATEQGWTNVEAKVIDAQDTKLDSDSFDAVLISYGVMLMNDPDAALKEALRILKPSGRLAFTTHRTTSWIDPINEAMDSLQLGLAHLDPTSIWIKTGQWHEPTWIADKLTALGFVDAKSGLHQWDLTVASMDAFRPMLKGMTSFTLKTAWTDEQIEQHLSRVLADAERIFVDRAHADGRISMSFVSPVSFARKAHL